MNDEAVQRAIEAIESNWPPSNYTVLREALTLAITALRQMRTSEPEVFEPCGKCHALYAVRTYRDGKDLGYIDIMTNYCPNCGRKLVSE